MCIHTIVLNRLIQIIYNKCCFLQRVSFGVYFILFIQGRTRFKMNIVIHIWYEFIDILKSCCKNGRAMYLDNIESIIHRGHYKILTQ